MGCTFKLYKRYLWTHKWIVRGHGLSRWWGCKWHGPGVVKPWFSCAVWELGFYFIDSFLLGLSLVCANGIVLGKNPLEWSTKPNRIYRFILLPMSSVFIISVFHRTGCIQCPDLRLKIKCLLQHKALGQRTSFGGGMLLGFRSLLSRFLPDTLALERIG